MHTLTIEIDDEAKAHWDRLARSTGRSLDDLLRAAIADRLEDLEDYVAVKERLSKPYESISDDEVWKTLGLGEDGGGGGKVASRSVGRTKPARPKAAGTDTPKRRRA
jgi:predicted DNA-binding protein